MYELKRKVVVGVRRGETAGLATPPQLHSINIGSLLQGVMEQLPMNSWAAIKRGP